MKLIMTSFFFLLFYDFISAQYIFHQKRLSSGGDTIQVYLYYNDSVVGIMNNGKPLNNWTQYFHDGSYMIGNYNGFLGQYMGKWDYFDIDHHLRKSIVYNSIREEDNWIHTTSTLDSIGNPVNTKIRTFNTKTKSLTEKYYLWKDNKNVLISDENFTIPKFSRKRFRRIPSPNYSW